MTMKNRLDGFEKQMKLAAAQLAHAGRIRTPMVYVNDPEDGLDELRLPDWVWNALGTIEVGRPDGKPETDAEWVARLTRQAAGEG
jgi:hypothetical protein